MSTLTVKELASPAGFDLQMPASAMIDGQALTAYRSEWPNRGRNIIINGDMRIAQRGTTAAMTTSMTYLSIDRWMAYMNGTADGVFNRVAGEGEFQYMAKWGRNASTTETGVLELRYTVESHDIIPLAGGVVTFSYYAKAGANFSAASSDLNVRVYTGTTADQGGSGAGWAGTATPLNTTQVITTTLTRYEHQITVAAGVKEIQFNLFWSPVGTAGADDNVYITGVQLEIGDTATPFEHRSYGEELALCQRYYQQYGHASEEQPVGAGVMHSSTQALVFFPYLKEMRTAPTGYCSGAGFVRGYKNGVAGEVTTATGYLDSITTMSARLNVGGWSSSTAGGGVYLQLMNAHKIYLDAEL